MHRDLLSEAERRADGMRDSHLYHRITQLRESTQGWPKYHVSIRQGPLHRQRCFGAQPSLTLSVKRSIDCDQVK